VCFYIPKKEQIKKDKFERAISRRWFGDRFHIWKQLPDHSYSSALSTKPNLHPLQSILLLQESSFSTHPLNYFSVSTASKCFTAVSGVQLRIFLGVVFAFLLVLHF